MATRSIDLECRETLCRETLRRETLRRETRRRETIFGICETDPDEVLEVLFECWKRSADHTPRPHTGFPMCAHLSRLRLFQRHLRSLVWVWVWVWDGIHSHASLRTRSPSSHHPPFTHYSFPPRSLVCGGQPSPHKPRLVVSHSTCPPLSSSPHAHSFVLGTTVINNNKGVCQGCSVVAPSLHAPSHAPLLLPLLLSHNIPLPRIH
jgi:hypothetical protein